MKKKGFESLFQSRQLIYKKVKVLMPHCPFCKEQLKGNGSDFSPFYILIRFLNSQVSKVMSK